MQAFFCTRFAVYRNTMDVPVLEAEKKEEVQSMESLDEPDEKPALLERLNEFRALELGTDVTFLVGAKQKPIHAHKIILACSSVVFKAMFYGLLSECPTRYPFGKPKKHDEDDEETSDSLDSVSSSISSSLSLSAESGRHSAADGEEEEEEYASDLDESLGEKADAPAHETMYRVHVTQTHDRKVATDLSLLTNRRYPPPVETVIVPDISASVFRKLIDFAYYDSPKPAQLNDQNVIEVLYAAKKYALETLINECVRYLLSGLVPSNALCLLNQARLFGEEQLILACLKVIDKHTDEAMEHIDEVDYETLTELLKRTELDPKSELVLFEAALKWAKAECGRRQLDGTPQNMRLVLGAAFHLIRFPLMSYAEVGVAGASGLLTEGELSNIFMHLSCRPPPVCRFPAGFRCSNRSKHTISRFGGVSSKRYSKRESRVSFVADREIQLYGVGLFGMMCTKAHIDDENNNHWSSQVELTLSALNDVNSYSTAPPSCIAKSTVFVEGILGEETPYFAPFNEAVCCKADQSYCLAMRFVSEGPIQTFCGKDGKDSVVVDLPYDQQVNFKFLNHRSAYGDDLKSEGQIPLLHFYVHWPEKADV